MTATLFLIGVALGTINGVAFGLAYADRILAARMRRRRRHQQGHPSTLNLEAFDAVLSPQPFNRLGAKK